MCIHSVPLLGAPSTLLTTRKHNTPSLPSHPDDPGMTCPSLKGLHWNLAFDETPPPTPEIGSAEEEYLQVADLDDLVWSKGPVPDS